LSDETLYLILFRLERPLILQPALKSTADVVLECL
jgi:hypothetical protein